MGWPTRMRSLRVHGQGSDKYDNVRIGLAVRLDTIQAAILIEKLKIFPDEIDARNAIARRYNEGSSDVAIVPAVPAGIDFGLGAIHHPRLGRTARCACRDAEGGRHSDGDLLPDPASPQQAYKHFPVGKAEWP